MREPGPFERHIREAIALNRQRRPGYVRTGGVRAALVSRMLVGSERVLLPIAQRLDRDAARGGCTEAFADVFAPMAAAPAATRSVSGAARGLAVSARAGTRLLRPLARAGRALDRGDTPEATARLDVALQSLHAISRDADVHLAMTTHLLESARLAASRADGPCQKPLARFARLHLAGVPLSLHLDALAAPLHARGVGLLVNDLPPIPAP